MAPPDCGLAGRAGAAGADNVGVGSSAVIDRTMGKRGPGPTAPDWLTGSRIPGAPAGPGLAGREPGVPPGPGQTPGPHATITVTEPGNVIGMTLSVAVIDWLPGVPNTAPLNV